MVVTFLNNLCLQIRNTSRQLFRPRHNCTLNQAFRCTLINIKVKSSSQRTRVENGGLFSRGKYQSRDYPDCDFRHICPLRTGSKMPLRTKLKKFRQSAYIQRKLMADMIFFLILRVSSQTTKVTTFEAEFLGVSQGSKFPVKELVFSSQRVTLLNPKFERQSWVVEEMTFEYRVQTMML